MTAMDFLPSDLDQVQTNFLDMIESDVNSHLLDLENYSSEKLNDFVLNNDISGENLNLQLDFDQDSKDVNTWLQNIQNWNDVSKVPQSLIDASNENLIENNNPNLLVNPQSVLPVQSTQQQSTQNVNQLNARNGVPIKINGQDAILTPTPHPQIQYVTVQNLGTDTNLNNTQIGYTVQPITLCPQVRQIRTTTTPSQNSPVLVEHLRNGYTTTQIINNNNKVTNTKKTEKVYPKPIYSYSCLIAMALKNSKTGNLPVSEIYTFMTENFPYFKTAPDGWKNSVRHNLSLNKCFAKVESAKPTGTHTRKGCLWALNPAKIVKMEEEIVKWRKKDPESVKHSMAKPENLELIEQGKAGLSTEAPDSPILIKSESPTPVSTPVKRELVSEVKVKVTQESAVLVKTEPETEMMLVDLKDVANLGHGLNLDAGLTDLALQNGLWDDDMQTDSSVTLSATVPQVTTIYQPSLQSPNTNSIGTQYHGNITYTCAAAASPVQPSSPMYNVTPTKTYPQTPTKVYPQTPTRIILA